MSLIPYGRQSISKEDIEAVAQTLTSDYLTQGPAVEAFENSLRTYLGCKHAVAVSNGTAALHLVCLALNLKQGDAVIVPAITFAATSNSVLYCGATPIFADIGSDDLCLCPESAEKAAKQAQSLGLKVKAIFTVHFGGLPSKISQLQELAQKLDAVLVEDSCHGLGAEYKAGSKQSFSKIGDGESALMSIWSFHPVKHIATGEGGAVSTNDDGLARKLQMLRSHGITKVESEFVDTTQAFEGGTLNRWYMEMQLLGYNYRLPDILAALGTSQMKRIESFVENRRSIADKYSSSLANLPFVKLPAGDSSARKHSYHLYPLRIDFRGLGTTREAFMQKLRNQGVGSQVHYLPVYQHLFYQKNETLWSKVNCPVAEKFYSEELSIPMFPSLKDEEQNLVIEAIRLATSNVR